MKKLTTTFRAIAIMLLASTLLVTSCKEDSMADMPGPGSDFTVDLSGTVIGEEGEYLADAVIKVNGRVASSDAQGIFLIEDLDASEGRNYLEVTKAGYFFSGRTFYVTNTEAVKVVVKLLEKELIGTISASAGGDVETNEGLKVQLPANAISGGYSGDIRVYGRFLDPTESETMLSVPGMEGENAAGEDGVLLSYGMGHIELEDGSGNELELADGITAEITMPIPDELTGSAEPTIPLWYFDEVEGIWKEEGQAQLQGDKYVGSVEHFSMWNCDDFSCAFIGEIQVTCPLVDLNNLGVRLEIQGRNFPTTVSVSSETGRIYTYLPCSEEIDVFILFPGTPTAAPAEYQIGTFSTGVSDTGPITVNTACPNFTTVSGCAVDAIGNPVTNGYMYMQFDDFRGGTVHFDDNGCFVSTIFDFEASQSEARLIAWNTNDFSSVEGPAMPFNNQVNELTVPLVFGGGSTANPEGRLYVGGEDDLFYCLDASNGDFIWSFNGDGPYGSSSSIVWNNRVYIGNSLAGNFYCLNALDGSLIWQSDFDNRAWNSPMIADADSMLYISEYDGNLFAYDALTGELQWAKWFCCGQSSSSPTISGDILYIGGGAGNRLIAIDRHTGDELWEYVTDDKVSSSPAVVDNRLFFSSHDQSVYALDATTGSLIWETEVDTGGTFYTSPTIDNGVLFQRTEFVISALDADNGDILWQIDNLSRNVFTQEEADGGRLYAWLGNTAQSLGLRCYNGQTGQEIYTKLYQARPNVSTIANGVMYHGAEGIDETITATDILTGQTLWTSNVDARLTAAPVVVDDNGEVHYCSKSGMEQ